MRHNSPVTATPTQQPDPVLADPALVDAAAVSTARAAAQEEAGAEPVGGHVGVLAEDEASVTHLFEAAHAGYRGWNWAVTVAFAGPGTPVSVSEVVLLPGDDALVAPDWVPWNERVRAGDLGVGDLLPPREDDPRLVPGYVGSDDPAVEEVALEVGLGRVRVLSREGVLDAASRWHGGDFGPRSDMARSAPATCGTCGFYTRIAGSLGAAFGVCANEMTPADGHVVHVEYGCGAHSEVEVEGGPAVPVADLVYDDATFDVEPHEPTAEAPAAEPEPATTENEAVAAEAEPTAAEAEPATTEAEPAAAESAGAESAGAESSAEFAGAESAGAESSAEAADESGR
ncbi:MAG: DUF3027 domain-containing protein [Saccharothrix sp.]|nr:DUF3027 domain-containing protein [Saccharothrix sp.]